jgi:cytochrome P450
MCFNESLRIEPPVVMSMDIKITENTELMNGRYKI